jgi:uncharacterized integral membrane protein
MRYLGWLAFLLTLIVAGLAVQNSGLPSLPLRLLFWQVNAPPVFVVLCSLVAGAVAPILLWAAYAIREILLKRDSTRQIKSLTQQIEELKAAHRSRVPDDRDEEGADNGEDIGKARRIS